MSQAVVADFQGCAFKSVDLSKHLVEWHDTRQPSIAVHRYIKRDGAEVEKLGRKPHEVKATLAYAGKAWRSDWLPLQATIDADPGGLLVHPVYGKMQVVCQGYDGATMHVENAANLYIVPLAFIEDSIDTRIQAPNAQGPTAKQNLVQSFAAALLDRTPATPSTQASVLRYVTTATTYAAAATTAALVVAVDPSLGNKLDLVRAAAADARAALRADPLLGNDATGYEALALVEQVYDACVQLDDAVRAVKPTISIYTVPSTMHISVLAVRFYGPDGLARIAEILANNAGRIPNPAAIRAGTELLMASPTVVFT